MHILGVDQGSTKTLAILAREDGNIIGKGASYGACHFFDGMEKAMQAVSSAAEEACANGGISPGDIDCIYAGLAGANFPEEITALEMALKERFQLIHVKVYNDCIPALRAGTANPYAGVICAGTGLNAALCSNLGVLIIYNNYIEDMDQGAGGLGRRMLHAIFLSEIGVLLPTYMKQMALNYFKLDTVQSLLLAYQRGQLKKPLSGLCTSLFECAGDNDQVALDVIANFGVSVSRYLIAGIRRYALQDQALDIVLSGGVFKTRCKLLMDTIRIEINRTAPQARVIQALFEPVVGTILFAFDELFSKVLSQSVLESCQSSAERLGLLRFQGQKAF